jgi:hypothetical protein
MAQKQRPPPWRDRDDDLKTEQPTQQPAAKFNDRRELAQGALLLRERKSVVA